MRRKPVLFASVIAVLALLILIGLAVTSPPRSVYAEPAVDAKIEIVWPHDPQGNLRPVAEASLANVGVDLTEHSNPIRAAAVNTAP